MAVKNIFKTQLSDVDSTARDTVGDIRYESGKKYKYVKLKNVTATVAGVAGDPVAYKSGGASSDGTSSEVVLDITDADTIPVCAGFLCGTVTGTAGTSYYCWVQLTGVVTVPTAITNGVVGNPVYLTTTDKTLAKSVEVDTAGAYKQNVGVEISATAANNKIIAQVAH